MVKNMDPTSLGTISVFGNSAKGFIKNPLGTISLFIVLIYAFAALVSVGGSFSPQERTLIVYFLVLFPVLVIVIFAWLVAYHSKNLFSPSDFADQSHYVQMQIQAQVQAATSLTAAISKDAPSASQKEIDNVINIVKSASVVRTTGETWKKCVLWVDDRPGNNIHERNAFEAMGLEFVLSETTVEALSYLKHSKFAVVISDMGRREGPREGYALLDALRRFDQETPLFFYAASNAPEHKAETLEHGGQGCTNDPQVLFKIVMRTIINRSAI